LNICSYKKKVIIVGNSSGRGGVQSVHRNLLRTYEKQNYNVYLISNLKSFIRYIFSSKKDVIVVYFSGLSILLSPFFLTHKKHVFFSHGFYVNENIKDSIVRFFKKQIYERIINISLFWYSWVYCISPSPTSALVNSLRFSRKIYVVPWGVDNSFSKYPINKNKTYKYHLSFLGRPNPQKLKKSSIDIFMKLFLKSKIVKNTSEINISFLIPKDNKYSRDLIYYLEKTYGCKINKFINLENENIQYILSETLYFFNCYEWEAFGITIIEALCSGCNILIPSTAPILPFIENISNPPIYKYTSPEIMNGKLFNNNKKLAKLRPSINKVKHYRKIFTWNMVINEIHNIIND